MQINGKSMFTELLHRYSLIHRPLPSPFTDDLHAGNPILYLYNFRLRELSQALFSS
uniref:Uncharacterized protein n=1 Tax=Octopus bimaculoides TaxID=37653 RepID=A0A0L8HHM8_OCTBM